MSHMTDSSPWLKRYVQNALSTTPHPQTLHGLYLQVISSVSPRRHLRVYDGRHTADAVLSPAAASHLDADPEDLGVTTRNLIGHLIAPVAAVVVPDASTTPPTATLVLNDLRVFSDRCAQRPPGVLPAVGRDPDVLNCLRANVGRKLATFATQSTFARQAAVSDRTVAEVQDLTQVFDDIVDNPALPPPDLLHNIQEFRTAADMDLQQGDDEQRENAVDQLPARAEASDKPVVVVDLAKSPVSTPPRHAKDSALSDENDSDEEMPELQILTVPGIGDTDEVDQDDTTVEREKRTGDADIDGPKGAAQSDALDGRDERTGDGEEVGNRDKDNGNEDAEDDADWEIRFGSQDQPGDDVGDDDGVAGEALPQTQHFTIDDDDDEDEDERDGDSRDKSTAHRDTDDREAVVDEADDIDEGGNEEGHGDADRDTTRDGASAVLVQHGRPKRKSARKRHAGQEGENGTPGKRAREESAREKRNNNGEITFDGTGVGRDPKVAGAHSDPPVTAGDTPPARAKNAAKLPAQAVQGMDTEDDPNVDMGAALAKVDAQPKHPTVDTDAPAPRAADVENGKQTKALEADTTVHKEAAADAAAGSGGAEETGDSVKPSSESEPSLGTGGTSLGGAVVEDKETTPVVKDKDDSKTPDVPTETMTEEATEPADSEKLPESEKTTDRGKAAEGEKPVDGGNKSADADYKPNGAGKAEEGKGKDPVPDTDPQKTDADTGGKPAEGREEPMESTAPEADEPMDVELPATTEVTEDAAAAEGTEVKATEGTESTQPPETIKEGDDKDVAPRPSRTAEDIEATERETQPPKTDKDAERSKPEATARAPAEGEDKIEPVEKKGNKRKAADFLRNDENQRKQMRGTSADPVSKEEALKKLHNELELLRNFRRKVDKNPTGFILNPDAFLPPLPGSATDKKSTVEAKQAFPPPDLSKYKQKNEAEPESEELPQVPDSAPI